MKTMEEAIALAQKLMKLAKSSNVHEAANAAQRAQEILARYEIDMAALDVEADAPRVEEAIQDAGIFERSGARLASWKPMLAQRVANVNACKVYTSGSNIGIVGRASDVSKVRYLYATLASEVDRLTATLARGKGRAYANSFRLGCVSAIGDSLRAAQEKVRADMRSEHAHNPHALVRIDKALARIEERDAELRRWLRMNMDLRSSRRSYSHNGSGFADGQRAGATVNVTGRGQAALGSGNRRIGA